MKQPVLLIGIGFMGTEYARILNKLKIPFVAVSRSNKKSEAFTKTTGEPVFTRGITEYFKQNPNKHQIAIIAVNDEEGSSVACEAIQNGIRRILTEKPAGLSKKEIQDICTNAKNTDSNVFVSYNRRFFASTLKTLELIKEDGGATSYNFEFTEWSHLIGVAPEFSEKVKRNWLLANSTHVIDMAFFIGGEPDEMSCYHAGGLPWHPAGSIFYGAGKTKSGILFQYSANWESAGRWGVEILTPKRKIILRPLETVQIQPRGKVKAEELSIDDSLDKEFKAGNFLQTKSFIENDDKYLLNIHDQFKHFHWYEKINGKPFS